MKFKSAALWTRGARRATKRALCAVVACIGLVVPIATAQPSMLDPTVTQVVTGLNHSCALTTLGGVKCWGSNAAGQLGDGSLVNRTSPVDVATLTSGVVAITAGDAHTCALLLSGGLKCWGDNAHGQLGDRSTVSSATPVDVHGYSSDVATVSAGATHTCAVTVYAGAVCWGGNSHGQLGHSSLSDSGPYEAAYLNAGIIGIAAGGTHTCALTFAGGVKCWGGNASGQLGDGTFVDYDNNIGEAVDVVGLPSGVASITAGSGHTCAVTAIGAAKCWGLNATYQLGDGTQTNSNIPVSIATLGSTVANISAGQNHTCATLVSGGLKCWGSNVNRQLGDGTHTDQPTPVTVTGQTVEMSQVAAGGSHSCAMTKYGGVRCWGANAVGQVGDGTVVTAPTAADVPGLASGIKAIDVSPLDAYCAITSAGTAKCGNIWNPPAVAVPGLGTNMTSLSFGMHHACSVSNVGAVRCWGDNSFGELGNGLLIPVSPYFSVPAVSTVQVIGLTSGALAVRVGDGFSCALMSSQGVKCWGLNDAGQLGDGLTTNSTIPIDVYGLSSGVAAIDAGGAHACALMIAGGVKCWGGNAAGSVPTDVPGLTSGVTSISVGTSHACAVTTLGGIKCWGTNGYGELGNGTSVASASSVDVVGLGSSPISIVSASESRTCAHSVAGYVLCWGINAWPSYGNNTGSESSTPIDWTNSVVGLSGLETSYYLGCGIKLGTSTAWCRTHNRQSNLMEGQAIAFAPPSTLILGAAPTPLSVTPVWETRYTPPATFSTWTPSICTVTGTTVVGIAPGLCGIQASRPAQTSPYFEYSYAAAPAQLRLLRVVPTYGFTTSVTPPASGTVTCAPNPVTEGGNAICTVTAAAGYSFSAFSGDCTGATCVLTNVTSDKSVTATFTLNTFPITASVTPPGSGTISCTANPVGYNLSSTCTASAAVGYTFSAWSGDCTGATCTLTNVTSAKSVTATFTLNTFPITTTVSPAGSGTISCTANPVGYNSNSTCTPSAAVGYTFSGWSGDCTGATCVLSNVTSAKSVTAIFTVATFVITQVASPPSGGGTITCTPNPVNYGANATCAFAQAPGFYVSSVSPSFCTGTGCTFLNVTAPKTVSVVFSPIITRSVAPVGGGSVSCVPLIAPFGGTVTCTATPSVGYTFSAFSGDCVGSVCVLSNVTGGRTVIASFTPDSLLITTSVAPAGSGTVACTPNPASYGTGSVCTATPAFGYSFGSWTGTCLPTGSTCSWGTIVSAQTLSATFTLNTYSITATASPPVGGSVSCSPNPVTHGSNASCTATAFPGYTFSAFSGSCSGSTCVMTNVSSAPSVTALFRANQVITSFAPPSPVTVGTAPVTISAVGGGSSSPVVFSTVSAPTVCTVSGNQVTIVGVGICSLRANQAGDSAYNAAPEASASIVINQGTSAPITWAALAPASRPLDLAAPFSVSPLATGGGSSNPVTYASATPLVCTVSGISVSLVGIGTCTITASQLGDANYAAPAPVNNNVTIFATLDVDNSGTLGTQYHATTDGVLIMRHLLGLSGAALTSGTSAPTATRTGDAALLAHLNAMRSALDVDGNTVVDATTDGVLVLRYLLGFRGSALIDAAVATTPAPSRATAVLIEQYLQTLMP